MESEVLGVDATVLGNDANLAGRLQVTAINNMASSILMPMFASFSKAHPQVELHIIVSNSDANLSQREADIAIRLTAEPTDTLIGKRIVIVASTIYGSRSYIKQLRARGGEPKWVGVQCFTFHKTWTKQSCRV